MQTQTNNSQTDSPEFTHDKIHKNKFNPTRIIIGPPSSSNGVIYVAGEVNSSATTGDRTRSAGLKVLHLKWRGTM